MQEKATYYLALSLIPFQKAISNKCLTTRSKDATRNKCIATSNKCLTSMEELIFSVLYRHKVRVIRKLPGVQFLGATLGGSS